MSDQPLLDISALKKVEAKPGDVFVLEIPESLPMPTSEEAARLSAEVKMYLGDGVKVLVLPPGAKLGKLQDAVNGQLSVQGQLLAAIAENCKKACPDVPVVVRDANGNLIESVSPAADVPRCCVTGNTYLCSKERSDTIFSPGGRCQNPPAYKIGDSPHCCAEHIDIIREYVPRDVEIVPLPLPRGTLYNADTGEKIPLAFYFNMETGEYRHYVPNAKGAAQLDPNNPCQVLEGGGRCRLRFAPSDGGEVIEMPKLPLDGFSPLAAGVKWADAADGIDRSRWQALRNNVPDSSAKPPRLRVLLDGQEIPIVAERSRCGPWEKDDIEVEGGTIAVRLQRRGEFTLKSWLDIPGPVEGALLVIEHLDDGERFEAIATPCYGRPAYTFRSDGAPSPLPVPASEVTRQFEEFIAQTKVEWRGDFDVAAENVEIFVRQRFPDGFELVVIKKDMSGDSDVAALAEAAACPQGHHLKDGPCRFEYCRCDCGRCRQQCEEGGR